MTEARYCRFCGTELPKGEEICPHCGRFQERPLGISVISILAFIGGGFALLLGSGFVVLGALAAFILPEFAALLPPELPPEFMAKVFSVLGASTLLFGVVLITSGVGLWRLKLWGWWLVVIGGLEDIAFSIYTGLVTPLISTANVTAFTIVVNLIVIAIPLVIVAYLIIRRDFFGKVMAVSKPKLVGLAVFALLPLIVWVIGSAALEEALLPLTSI